MFNLLFLLQTNKTRYDHQGTFNLILRSFINNTSITYIHTPKTFQMSVSTYFILTELISRSFFFCSELILNGKSKLSFSSQFRSSTQNKYHTNQCNKQWFVVLTLLYSNCDDDRWFIYSHNDYSIFFLWKIREKILIFQTILTDFTSILLRTHLTWNRTYYKKKTFLFWPCI
jgi:hypothetical protein